MPKKPRWTNSASTALATTSPQPARNIGPRRHQRGLDVEGDLGHGVFKMDAELFYVQKGVCVEHVFLAEGFDVQAERQAVPPSSNGKERVSRKPERLDELKQVFVDPLFPLLVGLLDRGRVDADGLPKRFLAWGEKKLGFSHCPKRGGRKGAVRPLGHRANVTRRAPDRQVYRRLYELPAED